MNRALLASLAAIAVMLSAAPAFALTTKGDVVSACTVNTTLMDSLKLSPKSWGKIITVDPSTSRPQVLQVDPTTGLPIVELQKMDLSDLTPVLPVLPHMDAGYRMHIAETGGTSTASDACKAAVASYVQGTGKVGTDLDKLLGELAYELIGKVSAGNGKLVEQALKAIATNVSDENVKLKEFIQQKATEAASGTIEKPKNILTPANPSGQ